ncbi:hypothetical protein [Actinoplanes aureus]|uniref:Uncharacterized protein n=1 Tax=Actinoplanes aureus TaxID=2792083 RepID=A0A931CJI4_9ACTN|nr:hypothetical protein [Actinoplanes aureus]MBG0567318.1 hypothetical protein [Actinoplanes aureus]
MIPTLILFGLVAGRWWRTTLLAGTLGWPILLLAQDIVRPGAGLLPVFLLAVVNTGAGVLVHQTVFRGAAWLRDIREDRARG